MSAHPAFSNGAFNFIQSWKTFDEAATKFSVTINVEHKNQRVYYPGVLTLKPETDIFVDAMTVFAKELDVNPVHLITILNAFRREGMDYTKAVYSVVEYLNFLKENNDA